MILEKIQVSLKEAMRAGDKTKVSALRFLLAQIHNREIALRADGKDLTDEEVAAVINKQTKERKESIEAFKQGGREDLARKEEEELEILNKYLPQQLTREELAAMAEKEIAKIGASGAKDFGRVMKAVMEKVKGQAEGAMVAKLVKEKLV